MTTYDFMVADKHLPILLCERIGAYLASFRKYFILSDYKLFRSNCLNHQTRVQQQIRDVVRIKAILSIILFFTILDVTKVCEAH